MINTKRTSTTLTSNVISVKANTHGITPLQIFTNAKTNINHLHVALLKRHLTMVSYIARIVIYFIQIHLKYV
jgi:hypothetical protein